MTAPIAEAAPEFRRAAPRVPGDSGLLMIRLAFLAGAMSLLAWTTADPDLWGHVRFGLDALRDRALMDRDPYSFTSDRAWLNHEWLAEIIFALAYGADGARGLVALKIVIIGITLSLVLKALSQRDWSPIHHDLLVGVAILGIFGRVHAVRPQLFSVVLCAALLLTLSLVDRGRRRLLFAVPILLGLWANLHGGYLVGAGVFGIWTAVRLYQSGRGRVPWPLLLIGGLTLVSTLANPYGVGLWLFLWETVGTTRVAVSDWAPLWRTPPIVVIQWVVVTATAVLSLRKARADPAYALIAGALCAATVLINRFDAFYTLSVAMLLGPSFGREAHAGIVGIRRRAIALWGVLGTFLLGGALLAERASCIEIVTGPEAEATRFAERLSGRMMTFFDWGEYAIWHLAPAIQVSMDGRRETVYSDLVTASHLRIYTNAADSVGLVERFQPDWIWFPRHWPVVARLQEAGWHTAFRGPVSVILGRRPVAITEVAATESGQRCFPQY